MKSVIYSLMFSAISMTMFKCQRNTAVATTPTTRNPTEVVEEEKSAINFIQNKELEDVLAQAKTSHKIIFLDFYASWCGPCKMMDRSVFVDQLVADKFNKKFINYKVDGESFSGVNVGIKYDISSYPTYLFLNENGTVIKRIEGSRTRDQFLDEAETALSYR